MRTAARAFFLPLIIISVSACDSDWGFGVGPITLCPDGYIKPTSMQISPSSLSLRIGEARTLAITRSSSKETSGTCYELPSWTSSNSAVATATAFEITAVGAGIAQLTATSGNVSASISVTVSGAGIATLTINAPTSLLAGQVSQASLIARDSAGNQVAIIGKPAWSSSDASILTVSEDGVLTARGGGAAIVRATAESHEASLAITITRSAPVVKFTAISAAFRHTCGIAGGGAVPQGSIICWGKVFSESMLAPSWMITGGRTFKAIDTGLYHSCAIAVNGETFCWGRNTQAQLGDGTASTRPDPTRVSTTETFIDLALGESFTCGLDNDGITYCWGALAGRSSATPVRLDGAPKFRQIVAERYMLCGLTDAGEVHCIGAGQQVTYATVTKISSPVAFVTIESGEYHTCGLSSNGNAYCWGLNSTGQIGTGPILVAAPTLLSQGLTFSSISPGGSSTCGITNDGAKCLGMTSLTGASNNGFYPVPGQYSRPLKTISNGTSHGCAIDNDGAAWCWGSNIDGQVGAGTIAVFSEPVMIVADPLR